MRGLVLLTVLAAMVFAGCGGDGKPTATPPPTGACCAAAGTCTVTTQEDCTGVWTAVACDPNPCAQPTGSCCASAGTCTVALRTACAGAWTMSGVCDPNPCVQPTGTCCGLSGACTVTTQAICSGTWTPAGVCSPNPCPPSLPEGMVRIPAGTFTMGSPASESGRRADETAHQVTLTRPVYVDTFEVTQSEWQAVMGWNDSFFRAADRPVERVTWYDAVSFCNLRSLRSGYSPVYTITGATHDGNHITDATVTWNHAANGFRLPTEAEWEYACRATSPSAFCNGGITYGADVCSPLDPNLGQVGWYCGNAANATHEVGGKTANAWGLKDMHGNIQELCWDWYGEYPGDVTDPTGPASGFYRVARGGSWALGAYGCRSAYRGISPHGSRFQYTGFRLFMTAP
jgi:formylglycine-generating enzyme required for sulfatase activity